VSIRLGCVSLAITAVGACGKNFSASNWVRSSSVVERGLPSLFRRCGIWGSVCGSPAVRRLHRDSFHRPLPSGWFDRSWTRRLQLLRALFFSSRFNRFERCDAYWSSAWSLVALNLRLARLAPASSSDAFGDQSGLALVEGFAIGQYFGRSSSSVCCMSLRDPRLLSRIAANSPSVSSFLSAYRLR